MDLTLSETKKRGEMELQHFSHHHPLLFIQHQSVTDEAAQCFGCEELIDGPSYGCNDCKYYLHKRCAELELTPHLNHPFHPQHLLTLLPKSPYKGRWRCDFCRRRPSSGFVYHCDPCKFDLHINCALLQSSIAPNFPTSLHQHPLFFIQDHNDEVNRDCSGCMKPLSGPIYYCLDCYLSDKRCFILHKQCAELPLEINHPYDRHKAVWDGKSIPEDYDERSMVALDESINWITDVVEQMSFGENTVAVEIKHAYHDHNLRLTFSGEMNDDGQCDGCMRPISTPFYSCEQSKCSACRRNGNPWDMAYRCTKRCDFTLDLQCATLPLTTWYKYDRHPLTLTCTDDSDPSQHYCDLCEHERDPNDWFYYCAECDNSLHSICALGDIPFLKIGSNIDKLPFHSHPHPFTIVKNIWDCPPCKFCGEVCNGQALQCKESECNFSIHWFCPAIFPRFSNSNE
ncbi:uncharacterized protein [Gossypium hirsutum]|uniref:Uncharacterized protein isoform X2 n=1 Tax=Gossypium hirsutum TaxID=3635 RepID=A0A1U8HGL7_GOSHI|nr:uncharacterized protein LOC107885994 isoform X2 [Gossypium hirsutum]